MRGRETKSTDTPRLQPEARTRVLCHFQHLRRLSRDEQASFLADLSKTDPQLVEPIKRRLAIDGRINRQSGRPFELEFQVHEEIGRGGTGVVFRATHRSTGETLALKQLPSIGSDTKLVERLERVAKTMSRLKHPAIVPTLNVCNHEGRVFVATPYVPGTDLAKEIVGGPVGPERAARIAKTVAEAVAHAHGHGIVHRDIKPSNILLDQRDRAYLTDFDLAKSVDASLDLTETGRIVGTLSYMSPEQARGSDVEFSADIYSIGAVLYCMLTGSPPFNAARPEVLLSRIPIDDPLSPRRVNPDTPTQLETICLKCLEKNAGARYLSAEFLADDLQRYLSGQPIKARPVSSLRRVTRWSRRNVGKVAMMALVATVLASTSFLLWRQDKLASTAEIATLQKKEADARADQAETERQAAQRLAQLNEYHAGVSRVRTEIDEATSGWKDRAIEILEAVSRIDNDARNPVELRSLAAECYAGVDLSDMRFVAQGFLALRIAISPDDSFLAVGQYLGIGSSSVRLYDVQSHALLKELHLPARTTTTKSGVSSLDFSPDGDWLVAGTRDGMLHAYSTRTSELKSWDAHHERVSDLDFSPTDAVLATCSSDKMVRIWSIPRWKRSSEIEAPSPCGSVAFSSDGNLLACMSSTRTVIWKTNRLELPKPSGHPERGGGNQVDFSNDGRLMGYVTWSGIRMTGIAVNTIEFNELFREPRLGALAHSGGVFSCSQLEFNTDGKLLASATDQGDLKIWQVPSGTLLQTIGVHGTGTVFPVFTSDSTQMATVADQDVRIYRVNDDRVHRTMGNHFHQVRAFDFSPDGKRIACAAVSNLTYSAGPIELTHWNVESDRLLNNLEMSTISNPENVPSSFEVCVNPRKSDRIALTICGQLTEWRLDDVNVVRDTRASRASVTYTHDGEYLVAALEKELFTFAADDPVEPIASWRNRLSEQNIGHSALTDLVARPGGTYVSSRDGTVRLFDELQCRPIRSWGSGTPVHCIAVDREERLIAAGTQDGVVKVYRSVDGSKLGEVRGHSDRVSAIDFCPSDPTLLVSGSKDGLVRLWRVLDEGIDPVLSLTSHSGRSVLSVKFTPDGTKLGVLVHREMAVRLWDLAELKTRLAKLNLAW